MGFVLDASVATSWAMADEDDAVATLSRKLAFNEEIVVPSLWWFEVRNGLLMAERRGRLPAGELEIFLANLTLLNVIVDRLPDEAKILACARRHRLTIYDASYLDLAIRKTMKLATLDRALARAARAEGVALVGEPPDLA